MATLGQILQFGWPGALWSLAERPTLAETYDALVWQDLLVPKPTLQQVLDLEAATDAWLSAEARKSRQADHLLRDIDALLLALDAYGDALADIAAKARLSSPLDQTVVNRVQSIRQKIAEAKAVP